jgi:hypothetical protein
VWSVRDPAEVLRHWYQRCGHRLRIRDRDLGFGQRTEDRGIRGTTGQGVTDALTGKLEHAEPGIGHRHCVGLRYQHRQRVRDGCLGQLGQGTGRAKRLEQPQRRIRYPQVRAIFGSRDLGGGVGWTFGANLEVHAAAVELAGLRQNLLDRFGNGGVHRERHRVEGIAGIRTGRAHCLHSEPSTDHDDDRSQSENRPGPHAAEPGTTTAVTSRHRCNPLLGPPLHSPGECNSTRAQK